MKFLAARNLLLGILVTILITSTSFLATAQTSRWEQNSRVSTDSFVTAQVSRNFTSEQRAFIYRALEVANRLSRDKTNWRRCLSTYATRDASLVNPRYSRSTVSKAIDLVDASAFNPGILKGARRLGRPGTTVWITRVRDTYPAWLNRGVLGVAQLDSSWDREGFRISLNENQFSQFSSAETWANVIVHEILHNYGYPHTQVNGKFDGSVIYEAGWCMERSFAPKSLNLAGEPVGGTVIGD